jgi:hypothetical protein
MGNPKKLATLGIQDEDKKTKTKNTTQYVLDTTMRKQTQITHTRHQPSNKQLEIKTNAISLSCGKKVHFREIFLNLMFSV